MEVPLIEDSTFDLFDFEQRLMNVDDVEDLDLFVDREPTRKGMNDVWKLLAN